MKIKLIIFDFDGPILDSFDKAKKSVLEGIEKLKKTGALSKKLKPNKEAWLKYWGYPGKKTAKLIFPGLKEKELKMIIDYWAKNELKKKIPLVKGAVKILKFLRKKYFTALLTARSYNLKFHLENYGLEKFFDIIQSWQNPELKLEKIHQNHIFSNHHKPYPEVLDPILSWAAKKGISKHEIIMIDDTLVGLETAKRANIMFLGVCTGPLRSKAIWQKYGKLDKKYIIKSIVELPVWLKKYKRT